MSAVAAAATAPLVSYCFGQIPLLGTAVNPPVILLTYGVVGVSLLWMAMPLPPLSVVVRPALEGLLSLQNRLVEAAATLPYAGRRLPHDGGAGGGALSLFHDFHPRRIPSVAEKSVTLRR